MSYDPRNPLMQVADPALDQSHPFGKMEDLTLRPCAQHDSPRRRTRRASPGAMRDCRPGRASHTPNCLLDTHWVLTGAVGRVAFGVSGSSRLRGGFRFISSAIVS